MELFENRHPCIPSMHLAFLSSRFFSIGFIEQDAVTSVITPSDMNLNWYFQLTFSATSTTIISGAMAERLYLSGCAGIARWPHKTGSERLSPRDFFA